MQVYALCLFKGLEKILDEIIKIDQVNIDIDHTKLFNTKQS